MSKEIINSAIIKHFSEWNGLSSSLKSYPNQPEGHIPKTGRWAKLKIEYVLRKIVSIGSKPCTARTGVIVIEVYERLDQGTKSISSLTDDLEDHFSFLQIGKLKTYAAYTIDQEDHNKAYFLSTVYVPFRYN